MTDCTVETRKCKQCGVEKSLTLKNFTTRTYKGVSTFYNIPCLKCLSRKKSEKYRANIESSRAKKKSWYRSSKHRERLLSKAKLLRDLCGAETQDQKSLRLRSRTLAAGKLSCSKCGEVKPLSEFRRHARREIDVPYYDKQCKACVGQRRKEWRDRNLDEVNRKAGLYAKRNREKINARCRMNGNRGSINRRKRVRSATFVPVTRNQITDLINKQRSCCAICKKKPEKLQIDHIMPLAKGGPHSIENMQMLCPTCNRKKNAFHPIDYMQKLGFLL